MIETAAVLLHTAGAVIMAVGAAFFVGVLFYLLYAIERDQREFDRMWEEKGGMDG